MQKPSNCKIGGGRLIQVKPYRVRAVPRQAGDLGGEVGQFGFPLRYRLEMAEGVRLILTQSFQVLSRSDCKTFSCKKPMAVDPLAMSMGMIAAQIVARRYSNILARGAKRHCDRKPCDRGRCGATPLPRRLGLSTWLDPPRLLVCRWSQRLSLNTFIL